MHPLRQSQRLSKSTQFKDYVPVIETPTPGHKIHNSKKHKRTKDLATEENKKSKLSHANDTQSEGQKKSKLVYAPDVVLEGNNTSKTRSGGSTHSKRLIKKSSTGNFSYIKS
ncbi:hypothetical protein Tco_1257012 [Tanacetum coccineum]